jgi:hypothetical protein
MDHIRWTCRSGGQGVGWGRGRRRSLRLIGWKGQANRLRLHGAGTWLLEAALVRTTSKRSASQQPCRPNIPDRPALPLSQGLPGIDPRGAARREEARESGGRQNHERHRDEGQRIEGRDAVEQRRNRSR